MRILVRELCAWYDRNPWLEHVRAERALYPPVDEGIAEFERGIAQLVRVAARCTPDEARTIAALADVAVYSSLLRAGMSAGRITNRIAEVVTAWLKKTRRQR
jgi:hypothetical protein